jgi:dienelactone hydrolase
MRRVLCLTVLALSGVGLRGEEDATRVLPPGKLPADARLKAPKTLNDYFPWTPPKSLSEWSARRQALREQMLVATGLWPMPERTLLPPTIHGRIERDGYTVEKVFFASCAGHYVSGNLYRPTGKRGRLPGVLCPHGHWQNGRFYDALASTGEAGVQKQLDSGAEKTTEGARYPLQARCAQIARMGCVVFHYDMVGVADSQPIQHRQGFTDAEAELRLQSFMGLQTFNSIRALDFLTGLPDVDAKRIGVTGASGGGTQTFMLCAIDDRPTVAFPAVMVSTAMQGGCVCENCSYLRVGTGNIELAALFAPKPLAMSGAHDWTIDIETKGLPQLKELYGLYEMPDRVLAKAFPQFEHNYNQVSRELMYNWFNKHLSLGLPEPVHEQPFVPIDPAQLTVFDVEHPRPADALPAPALRSRQTLQSDQQLAKLAADDFKEWRHVMMTALRVMVGGSYLEAESIESKKVEAAVNAMEVRWHKGIIGRKGEDQEIPLVELRGKKFDGTAVVWIHPRGKESLVAGNQLNPTIRRIIDRKAAIVAPDVFMTGEFTGALPRKVDEHYAGFTFGYNQPILSERVRDILTTVGWARSREGVKRVLLVGMEDAGPWVLFARPLCGDRVERTALDCGHFNFKGIQRTDSPMMLPGALKYGGLPAFLRLCDDAELLVFNAMGTGIESSPSNNRLVVSPGKAESSAVVEWLFARAD